MLATAAFAAEDMALASVHIFDVRGLTIESIDW